MLKSLEIFQSGFINPVTPVPAMSLHALTRAQAHAIKAMLQYQAEALGFLKHRYREDIKLVDDLLARDGAKDSFEIWVGFFQKAISEYSNEAGKMASIGSRLSSETANSVRKEAAAVIEDMVPKPSLEA